MNPSNRHGAASVRARLLNVAKAQGVDFNQVLVRFALERILYRLTKSPYADHFLLKGALLFTLWYDMPLPKCISRRATSGLTSLSNVSVFAIEAIVRSWTAVLGRTASTTISDQTSSSFTWRASRHQALAGVAGTAVLRMCGLET